MSTQSGTSVREYEFEGAEEDTIRTLASAMKFVAVVEIILGALNVILAILAFLAGSFGSLIVYGITATVTIILAAMLSRAAGHFRGVVETEGNDITHLMGALAELRSYFVAKKILYIIAIALFVFGFVFVFMFARSGGSHY